MKCVASVFKDVSNVLTL